VIAAERFGEQQPSPYSRLPATRARERSRHVVSQPAAATTRTSPPDGDDEHDRGIASIVSRSAVPFPREQLGRMAASTRRGRRLIRSASMVRDAGCLG
jgi:hypothetical protein